MLRSSDSILGLILTLLAVLVGGMGMCQSVASGELPLPRTIKGVIYDAAPVTDQLSSAVVPPSPPRLVNVSATLTESIKKASGSSTPTQATATFNKSVALTAGQYTSMTIYVLNIPVTMGMATINISGTLEPIYINSYVQTITSDSPGFSTWFSGSYTGITVYNHDTDNQWNPLTFNITWQ